MYIIKNVRNFSTRRQCDYYNDKVLRGRDVKISNKLYSNK